MISQSMTIQIKGIASPLHVCCVRVMVLMFESLDERYLAIVSFSCLFLDILQIVSFNFFLEQQGVIERGRAKE